MKTPGKAPRRDAVLKNIPEGDPRREQIAEWLAADGWESCAQQCYSQLGISVDGKPVSRSMVYEAVKFWRQQEHFASMLQRAANQAQLMSEQKEMTAVEIQQATDAVFVAMAAEEAEASGNSKDLREWRYLQIRAQEASGNARIAELKLQQKDKQIAQAERNLGLAERRVKLLEDNAAKAKAALEQVKTAGGMTPETLKIIEEAARLL